MYTQLDQVPDAKFKNTLETLRDVFKFKIISQTRQDDGTWTIIYDPRTQSSTAPTNPGQMVSPGNGHHNPSDVTAMPKNEPAPFAQTQIDATELYWPVITNANNAMVVSHLRNDGEFVGGAGRHFAANRHAGRYHVGVDLYCHESNEVVAITDGKIVNYYLFYTSKTTGEDTWSIIIDHGDFVVNYGEVKSNSHQIYGWSIGDKVRSGQKIGTITSLNMLHFETYLPGTKANLRWMKAKSRPNNLLNPTKLLLQISQSGKRLLNSGYTDQSVQVPTYIGPKPLEKSWHSVFGGQKWRTDHRGVFIKGSDHDLLLRTPGSPHTCRMIWDLYSKQILEHANKHKVNPALVMMTIATETAIAKDDGFTGQKTFRWETHVTNKDVVPEFDGSYSAGPMQVLATTARDLIARKGAKFELDYTDPFQTFEPIRKQPKPAPSLLPLYNGNVCIDIGTAYIRSQLNKTKHDPVLVSAAYNAGSLRHDSNSPWGLVASGDHIRRAAEFYGDALAVLTENGII